ncbi:MAG: hypothetical protein ACFE9L_20350 [Candidatus Hodarchaeota archaeon]
MPIFTPDLNISIGIIILNLIIQFYLIIRFLNRYFTSGYPKTLGAIILSLLTAIISNSSELFGILIDQTEIELFGNLIIDIHKVSAISFIIAVYFILLFTEVFEYDTIFTRQQMITTIILTITVFIIFGGDFQPFMLENENMYSYTIDLSNFLIMALTGIIGIFMMLNLQKGLQDSWIAQRRQLILMMVGVSVGLLFPLVYKTILIGFNVTTSIILNFLLESFFTLVFIVFLISFSTSDLISLLNRRKADKIVVTSQNGIPLFMYDFKIEVHRIDATLFSGAIVAITLLMSESIKSPAPIAEVLMKNKYKLILESKPSFIALIFSPAGSQYLRDSLERFTNSFEKSFSSIVESGEVVDLDLFAKGGVKILFQSFKMPATTHYTTMDF